MPGSTGDVYKFFADCGARYRVAYLAGLDAARLREDQDYGVKHLLFRWAFERAGAPRSFRVAAVKAISSAGQNRSKIPHQFARFCTGKTNPKLNPVIDPRIAELDVRSVVRDVERGAVEEAFRRLELKGLGHKLRAFFLRDLVCIFDVEALLGGKLEHHVWCQPIDIWVRSAAEHLASSSIPNPSIHPKTYGLNRRDLQTATTVIQGSFSAAVSPISVNQGIWYFASNVVADTGRLTELLRPRHRTALDAELALMAGFLPASDRLWEAPINAIPSFTRDSAVAPSV
jgi:hypothetical protein